MKIASLISLFFVLSSCGQVEKDPQVVSRSEQSPSPNEANAIFAEGCFWHSELVFQSLVGVRDAVSGYAGGSDTSPDYEKVSIGNTGHAEAVKIYYDPSQISYETLVKAFFASHDPTTLNRQGNDVGTEYRSIAFYNNNDEKKIIEKEIKRLIETKKYPNKIVTEVKPYTTFYPAEEYHQEFIQKNPDNGYVNTVSIPDFLKFKKNFKGNYK